MTKKNCARKKTRLIRFFLLVVKFIVGQHHKKEVLAHKYILLLNSPVFQNLLEGTQMNKTVTITVSDVEPDAFMSFLKVLLLSLYNLHKII